MEFVVEVVGRIVSFEVVVAVVDWSWTRLAKVARGWRRVDLRRVTLAGLTSAVRRDMAVMMCVRVIECKCKLEDRMAGDVATKESDHLGLSLSTFAALSLDRADWAEPVQTPDVRM